MVAHCLRFDSHCELFPPTCRKEGQGCAIQMFRPYSPRQRDSILPKLESRMCFYFSLLTSAALSLTGLPCNPPQFLAATLAMKSVALKVHGG
mmetsp:Transcript_34976/g.79130  ORF Transcript_34976/g.79130 Transcript_34976/m.79130 type:complete len:92 (+) Transcript_34976:4557-4832(+)